MHGFEATVAVQLCKACFFAALEEEVHQTITHHNLFSPRERVAVAASGTQALHLVCRLLPVCSNVCHA